MFKKMKLNSEIKKRKKNIEFLEHKRSRSQAALVEAILTHATPDDQDVEYFNYFTKQIDDERDLLHRAQNELNALLKK